MKIFSFLFGLYRKRPLIMSLLTIALVVGAMFWMKDDTSEDSGEYFEVRRGDFLVSITEGGSLQAVDETVVRNELEGSSRIIYIIPEGTVVKKGDLLVELDAGEAEDALSEQKILYETTLAGHIAAENDLVIMKSTVESEERTADLDVLFADMDLQKFIDVERDQEKRNAEIEIITAEEALKIAQEKLQWSKRLTAEGFETKSNLDRDQLAVTNQSLGLEKAVQVQKALNTFDLKKLFETYKAALSEARAELERVRKQGESKIAQAQADLNSAKQKLDLNQAKLEKMKEQFTATKVYAPQPGMVVYSMSQSRYSSESMIEEGATVRMRQGLIKIPDISRMKVEIKVHESHVSQVNVGQPAFVVLDSLPDKRFRGKVTKVGILPDSGSRWGNPNLKVYSTEVEITDPLPDVKPGVSARAEVVITKLTDVVTVPIQSVTTKDGKQMCYVKRMGGPEAVVVEIGLFNNKFIEIRSGLKEGDEVLLAPPLEATSSLDGDVVDGEGEGLEGLPTGRPEKKEMPKAKAGGRPGAKGAGKGRPGGGEKRPDGGAGGKDRKPKT